MHPCLRRALSNLRQSYGGSLLASYLEEANNSITGETTLRCGVAEAR